MIQIGLRGGGRMIVHDDGEIDVSQVTYEALAFGLSYVTRFGGMAGGYSVAEHSVHLFRWAQETNRSVQVKRALLLHDAPECLGVGDVQRFVKKAYADRLVEFDKAVTEALWLHFSGGRSFWGTWKGVEPDVKALDVAMGALEAGEFGFPYDPASLPTRWPLSRPVRDRAWTATVAESEWLSAWRSIK